MKTILSTNEQAVMEMVFKEHDPDIKLLCELLQGKLIDKQANIVTDMPDMRFVSKLKSTGLKKISDSLLDIANSLRLDISKPPSKYHERIKACIKGLNFMINAEIYIIYLLDEGPVVWYIHDSQSCNECVPGGLCTKTLQKIITERDIKLPEEFLLKKVDEKADYVFTKILK